MKTRSNRSVTEFTGSRTARGKTENQQCHQNKQEQKDEGAKTGVDITERNDDLTQLDQEQEQEQEWTEWSDYVHDEETASESEVDNEHQEQDNESDDKAIPMKSTADEENKGKDRPTTSKDATVHGSAEHPKAKTYKTRHATEIPEIIGEDLKHFDNAKVSKLGDVLQTN